eukprot:1079246-Rhodomonas_salina.2
MIPNTSSGAMLDRGRQLSSGNDGLGATAITVGCACTMPNASSGAMLDRGRRLSPSRAFEQMLLSSHKLQSLSRARQGAFQTLSRGRSKTPSPGSRSAPSQAFPALAVSQQSGWTRTGHWHPRL